MHRNLSIARYFFFFQAEDGIRDYKVTGVQTCALPISNVWRRESRIPERLPFLSTPKTITPPPPFAIATPCFSTSSHAGLRPSKSHLNSTFVGSKRDPGRANSSSSRINVDSMLIQTVAEAIKRGGTGPAGSNVPYRGAGQPRVMLAGSCREFASVRAEPGANFTLREMARPHKLRYFPQAPLRPGNRQ